MGRQQETHDPAVVHSSISLLQERFRQLQRVKEMREERELLRLLSLSDPKKLILFNTCMLYDPALARFFSHPELILKMLPARPPPQTSLSLWPTSHSQSPSQGKKHAENNYYKAGVGVDIPPLMNLWPPADTTYTSDSATSLYKLDDDDDDSDSETDIDTSLHL